MSRRRSAGKRKIAPDTRYNSVVVAKFINFLMQRGKKGVAQKIFYSSLDRFKGKVQGDVLEIFQASLDNVKPRFEVKSRRVGGSTYRIPVEVKVDRKLTLAIRWLIASSQARRGKSMVEKLSEELIDAYNKKGGAVKKKEDVHKMAEANKAFSHYAWHGR